MKHTIIHIKYADKIEFGALRSDAKHQFYHRFLFIISKYFREKTVGTQHTFDSVVCFTFRCSAGATYMRTDKLYASCSDNKAISSNQSALANIE